MRRPIINHTKRAESVYDPFLGSGTTLVAAELTGRVCCGLELDPKYVDVIIGRWQKVTGNEAKLDGSGATFHELQSQRRQEAGEPDEEGGLRLSVVTPPGDERDARK
jgi:DNA modification methylase